MKRLGFLAPALLAGCMMCEYVDYVPASNPVLVADVILQVQAKVNDWQIESEIRSRGIARPVTADDVVAMKKAGASDSVVRTMLEAPVLPSRPAMVRRRVYYDTRPAEAAFTVGLAAAALWTFGFRCW